MKRKIAMIVAASMVAGSLVACSNTSDKKDTKETVETTKEVIETEVTETEETEKSKETEAEVETEETTKATVKETKEETESIFDSEKNEKYANLWRDYIMEGRSSLNIGTDLISGVISIPDALDGNAVVGVYAIQYISNEEAKTGNTISINGTDYVIGEDFEADLVAYDETYHIEGRVIEWVTVFDKDGNLDTEYNTWLSYDEDGDRWAIWHYTGDDDVGMYASTCFAGYQEMPVASDCEIYYSVGGSGFTYESTTEDMTDEYGNSSEFSDENKCVLKFNPANTDENVFSSYLTYMMNFTGDFAQREFFEDGFSEQFEIEWESPERRYAYPVFAFMYIENGEISKVYFAWIPCGAYHWSDGENALGVTGTGDYYVTPY